MLRTALYYGSFLVLCFSYACKTGSESTSTVEEAWLGETANSLLKEVNQARVYHIAPFQEENQVGSDQFAGFPILYGPIDLYDEELEQIKRLLQDTSSYIFSNEIKMCLFTPNLGVQFKNIKGIELDILISLDCNQTQILQDGVEIFRADMDPARAELLKLFYPIFKNEPYFQALK